MDETEDCMSFGDRNSIDGPLTAKNKPKKRSLIERELETNLTSRVTSPVTNSDGTNTSRYGRARRLKSEIEPSDTKKLSTDLKSPTTDKSPTRSLPQSPVYRMHASNSPIKSIEIPKNVVELDNQIESIYQENISLSRFSTEEVSSTSISPAKKYPKVYIRKDLLQKRETEDTVIVIKNMFSPVKSTKKSSNTHLNNILERSSERYSLENKSQNGYLPNSSVVKTLDFDSKKKKNDSKNAKSVPTKNENKDTKINPTKNKVTKVIITKNENIDNKIVPIKNNNKDKIIPSKNELFDLEAKCTYQVGDLVWARMGTYPFWPSIVTRDPSTGIFVKKKLFGRIERDIIHVTFLGDNGRRGWIVDTMLRKYLGQLEFEAARENFTPEAKKKDPRLYAAFFISEKKQDLWNTSVEEAEMLLREPKRLRIELFNDILEISRSSKGKQPRSKLNRTDSDVSLSESLYDSLFFEEDGKSDRSKSNDRSKKRPRKQSLDMIEVVTACLDNMAAKTGITTIQKQSHMDRWLQKAKSKTPEKTKTKIKEPTNKDEEKKDTIPVTKKKYSSTPKRPAQKRFSLRKSSETRKSPRVSVSKNSSDVNSSQKNNDICVIAKVVSLAGDTQVKAETTELNNENHLDNTKWSSMDTNEGYESDTYTDEYAINDFNNTTISEDKSNTSASHTEKVSKNSISEISGTELQNSSVTDVVSETDNVKTNKDINESCANIKSDETSSKDEQELHSVESPSTVQLKDDLKMSKRNLSANVDFDDDDDVKQNGVSSDTSAKLDNQPSNLSTTVSKNTEDITNGIPECTNGVANKTKDTAADITKDIAQNKTSDVVKSTTNNVAESTHNTEGYITSCTLRSKQEKKQDDPLSIPEFVKYMELRRDAITDENPDLTEHEIVTYLYKTWIYNKNVKSDDTKNDDLRGKNLIKGLSPPTNAQSRNKRNLSINKSAQKNRLPRYLRNKKKINDEHEMEQDITIQNSKNMGGDIAENERKNTIENTAHDIVEDTTTDIAESIAKDLIELNSSNMANHISTEFTENMTKENAETTIREITEDVTNTNAENTTKEIAKPVTEQQVEENTTREITEDVTNSNTEKTTKEIEETKTEQNLDIEGNEADNMSVDYESDSDSERLPYSPLSNLCNSDDNLSLDEAPFVNNVPELDINEEKIDLESNGTNDYIPSLNRKLRCNQLKGHITNYEMTHISEQSKLIDTSNTNKFKKDNNISRNKILNVSKTKYINSAKEINILEHKVGLLKNIEENIRDSVHSLNNGYKEEKVREIEMASKEIRIYVSDCQKQQMLRTDIKENGFHAQNGDIHVTTMNSELNSILKKSDTGLKLRSRPEKKKDDPLSIPEFVKYMELRRDAITDEKPDLIEHEIITYLYKTWLYEENAKSDDIKGDDLRGINLIKGLSQPTNAQSRNKRNLSINESQAAQKNRLPKYLRNKKDVTVENDEICIYPKKGSRKNMIKYDDEDTSEKEEEKRSSLNINKRNVDLTSLHLDENKYLTDKAVEEELKNISEENDQVSVELPSSPTIVSKALVNRLDDTEKLNETVNSKQILRSPSVCSNKTDGMNSIDSEDSETPLIKCKLRSKAKKEKDNSKDKKIKEEDADTISINSEDSEISITKLKKKINDNKTEPSTQDPEFLNYLELRQDTVIDEHPELTLDEIVSYLYQTWLYEENSKSEIKKNDEIKHSSLVKGLKDPVTEPKKVKRKVPKTENSANETQTAKNKPKRKSVKPFYNEEYSDIEDELEVFEIFKPKLKDVSILSNNQSVPSTSVSEPLQTAAEVYDEVEMYFAELTKPKPNIFKGILREKVCEICEKPGTLVKCKGCNDTFHFDCVSKKVEIAEVPIASRGRKKKKKTRGRPKNSDDDDDRSQSTIEDNNVSIEDILETDSHVINEDIFEAQLSAKMKEILETSETVDYEEYSSDDGIDWKETIPGKCEIVDVILKPRTSYTESDYANFKCNNCQQYETPVCFVCKAAVSKKETTKRQKCNFAHCNKYYHLECLDHWPQTQFNGGEPSKNNKKINEYFEALTCPRHVCHTCVSDDPRGCKTRFSGDKLARCVRCPATYHSFTKCLPAGTQILSASHIVCPRHYEHRPGKVPCHVNTGWCFICALGGSLICCEYCPTSFHAECLNIDPPEGGYMCEDCETGRLPLYGEMVWVKLGHYRWWPGIVLHLYEIPENLLAVKHSPGEFVVRFFGQYDHYWVNRGRVFPFQEGDSGRISSQKSKIDAAFTMAMEHAQRACEILKKAEPNEEEYLDIQSSLLPPHYVKLKVNKPCGSLCGRRLEDPESSLTQCECNPLDDDPCGPYSQCLNRMLLTECGPTCRAGDRCNNRAFEKRLYPKLVPYRTPMRGWGLKTLDDIKAGQFVIEYVGELIDEEEFRRRMRRKHEIRDENFYFLTLDKERMIDAGPKGNLARFMNHCCEPNCETQKWTVLGDVRVGLFALYDIPAKSEVTFNYNLECAGIDKKRCMCGAKRCSGYIGAKPKQEETQPKKSKLLTKVQPNKKTNKKRKPDESPSTKPKPKRPLGRPPKPKELTEIEKDLLIIQNATNSISSNENCDRSKSVTSEIEKKSNPKSVSSEIEQNSNPKSVSSEIEKNSDTKSVSSDIEKNPNPKSVSSEIEKHPNPQSVSSEIEKISNPKALKRKRVSFTSEDVSEVMENNGPSVKKNKIDDKLEEKLVGD